MPETTRDVIEQALLVMSWKEIAMVCDCDKSSIHQWRRGTKMRYDTAVKLIAATKKKGLEV
jgi:DNA-binding transcriptional regulator YiaG